MILISSFINFVLKLCYLNNSVCYQDMFLFRFADQIAIGDEILVYRKDELVPTKVLKISSLLMKGTKVS